jgi:hypothetical protein
MDWSTVNRRKFLAATAGGLAASVGTAPLSAQLPSAKEGTVRDRLWLFGSPAGRVARPESSTGVAVEPDRSSTTPFAKPQGVPPNAGKSFSTRTRF